MEASKTISMHSFRLLLLLIIFGGLPFTSGRQIMTPEDSRMTSNSSTYSTLGHLGQDMFGEYMMEHNNPKVGLNEKEKQASADEIKPLLRADVAAPAGSSESSSTAGFEKAFKDWGLWVLLVLFSTGCLGFACNCYIKDSAVSAPPSAPSLYPPPISLVNLVLLLLTTRRSTP